MKNIGAGVDRCDVVEWRGANMCCGMRRQCGIRVVPNFLERRDAVDPDDKGWERHREDKLMGWNCQGKLWVASRGREKEAECLGEPRAV